MSDFARRQGRGLVALVVLSLVMTVLAVLHRGVPAAQLNLNDGGVWVTNSALRLVGHLNYPSRTLDGGLVAGSRDFDVSQDATAVLLHDVGNSRTQPVDGAQLTLGRGANVPSSVTLVQGGQTVAAVDSDAGKVWVMPVAGLDSFNPDADPLLADVQGARVAVGVDGLVHVVLPDGSVKLVTGSTGKNNGRIEGLADLATADLTTVGPTLVVLDRASSTVRTTRGSVPIDDPDTIQLQQPGPEQDKALLAGSNTYVWAPLDGGDAEVIPSGGTPGTPAQPVLLTSCAYLAWAGSGQYVRDCPADADDRSQTHEKIARATQLAFRVNRDVIVLNDLVNGTILLPNEGMLTVDNWQMILNQTQDKQKEKEDDSTTESTPEQAPQQQKTRTRPVAVNDDFGARPGRTVTLPVLHNDSDADGDVLTASVAKQPTGATVAAVRGGEALSITIPEDAAPGRLSFTYTASDGKDGTAEATCTVTIYAASDNKAEPKPLRTFSVTLGERGQVSYSTLGDWIDPQGDTIYLVSATGPADLNVTARPDGVVALKDRGTGGPGSKEVTLVVSDGTAQGEAKLRVLVKAGDNLPPVANSDHATAIKGTEVVVHPLANDVDPDGDELRLASAGAEVAGLAVTPDFAAGTLVVAASTAGTFYLPYDVTDGPSAAVRGYVRLDVSEPADRTPPVATDDVAMLPEGGSTVIDPLANDTDPMGGILVIQRVDVPASARGLAVEVIDQGLLRVSAPAGLDGPTAVAYTISNGVGPATGRVTVLPLAASATSQPPVAGDDKGLVRAGDILTMSVLDNDTSPSGLPLTLDPIVTLAGDAATGEAFVSGDALRFRAKQPGTIRLAYTVRDSAGNYDSAEAVVTINAVDASNAPPQPKPLVGRVLAGQTVTLKVPTDGVDPNGDSVGLVGITSAPSLGTAVVADGAIAYTAPRDAAGTDTLTYEVADRFGDRSTATIRVGVAPPNATNQAPVAVPDDVATRPGRALNVNPVANDTDPDGDALTLVNEPVVAADDTTNAPATVSGGQLELDTPKQETTLRYYYGVTDSRGGTAKGVATVRVSEDAVLRYPIAADDLVTSEQIREQDSVEVDVLANDHDPDGSRRDLTLSCDEPGVSVANGKITVPVTPERQVLLYSVTDVDDQTTRAAIIVAAADAVAPYVNPERVPVSVKAGELLELTLADYVVVREGRTPTLTFETKVKTGPGADQTAPVRDDKTLQFRAGVEFAGLSSISFEVTDGTSPEDPNGLKASLTIPIQVEPSGLNRPVFTPSEVTVAQGESASADLRAMVTDVDEGDAAKLRFSLRTQPTGLTVALNGSTLEVKAPADAARGQTASVEVTVTDGTTEPVTGTIPLRVTSSTRPLMSVTTAVVADAKAGVTSTIDLAGYITNPFADDGSPVTLVGQPTSTSGGTATASGLVVSVTPDATFHGQLSVSYTAADATGDASRNVKGLINLTVRAKPDAPTGVTAETHLSRTATVNWTAGANNGAAITGFTVSWSGGSKPCGQATTCTIDTLQNDQPYTFTVTATNEVGESEASDPSNEVRPDVKPNPPGTPSATFGDKQMSLTWAASTTEGSSVTGYTVEISPAAGGATQQQATGTSFVWQGLTNGTAYTFRVQAVSKAEEPSEWSGYSAAEIPAGVPAVPAAPKATKNPVGTMAPSATVTWTAPNGNGDTNLTYELRRTGASDVLYSGTATSTPVTMSVETADQSYEVQATNKAGVSGWSPASNGIRGWQVPGAVTGLTVTPTGQNNTVQIGFGAADGKGALPSEIEYYWTAGSATQKIASGGGTVTNAAFVNGQNVNVSVYAKSTVNGESAQGAPTSATVSAYGPPVAPSVTSCSSQYQAVVCSWSGGNANGRPTTFFLQGSASGDVAASDSRSLPAGFGETRSLQVCARQTTDGGGTRDVCGNTGSNRAWDAPSASWRRGDTDAGCTLFTNCAYVTITLDRWRPGSTVRCSVTGVGAGGWTGSTTVDGNGFKSWVKPANASGYILQTGYSDPLGSDFGTCTQG